MGEKALKLRYKIPVDTSGRLYVYRHQEIVQYLFFNYYSDVTPISKIPYSPEHLLGSILVFIIT